MKGIIVPKSGYSLIKGKLQGAAPSVTHVLTFPPSKNNRKNDNLKDCRIISIHFTMHRNKEPQFNSLRNIC